MSIVKLDGLRDARLRKGMTIEEVEKKSGVAASIIEMFETGAEDWTIDVPTLVKVAGGLGLRLKFSFQ